MGPIVCATRGGEASRRTQERAIALAKERGAPLIFLCIVDPGFAGPMDDKMEDAISDELKRLGRSLLCIAQARAEEEGIEAETVVRSGAVRDNTEKYLQEVNADTLVIGSPGQDTQRAAFGTNDTEQLAKAIERSTGVEVITVT